MLSLSQTVLLPRVKSKISGMLFISKAPPRVHKCLTQSMKNVQHRVQKTVWEANGGERTSSIWLPQATLCPLYTIKTSWLARRWLAHHAWRSCSSSDADRGWTVLSLAVMTLLQLHPRSSPPPSLSIYHEKESKSLDNNQAEHKVQCKQL